MPLDARKLITIIKDEAWSVEERCSGYKQTILEAVADILESERKNRVQGGQIQKRVTDLCCAAGSFLAKKRGHVGDE